MKSLTLTEEHKAKLLEMAKVLFPEWHEIIWGKKYAPETDYLWFSEKYTHPETKVEMSNLKITIHWFEFCFLHLVSRLQNALPEELIWRKQPPYVGNVYNWKEGNKWTLYTEFTFAYPKACAGSSVYPPIPIDFLYKEFKKLK